MRIICLAIALLTFLPSYAQENVVSFKSGVGDASKFIINKAVEYGGTPEFNETLPQIVGAWSYVEDEFGVVIHMSAKDYEAVKSLLSLTFGSPNMGPDNVKGGVLGVYRLTSKGGAIQFGVSGNNTQVVIMRQPGQVKVKEP